MMIDDVRDIDLPQLRALAAVVDEGSFDAAAVALHITPSAVSQRIKSLEQSVGRVLVRRTKPSETTDAGHAYLRLARQIDSLLHETRMGAVPERRALITVPIAVNADSLATWVLPALATVPDVCFDLHRDDEGHTADLLRAGTVMAAITADAAPVQGCRSTRLGTMTYRPMASPAYVQKWFATGVDPASLAAAPVVAFDRKDDIQDRYLRLRSRRQLVPPRHHVPSSTEFAEAVRLGLGWGMLPPQQSVGLEQRGELVEIDPGRHVDVTLYWQHWAVQTPVLAAVAEAVRRAAAEQLS